MLFINIFIRVLSKVINESLYFSLEIYTCYFKRLSVNSSSYYILVPYNNINKMLKRVLLEVFVYI
jgi:hypothetical protein